MSTPAMSVHQSKKSHFFLLLDASSSLLNYNPRQQREYIEGSNAEKLIQVVDAEILRLAGLADLHEPDPETGRPQEIRVSIAQFATKGEYRMLIWDMDPRTLPSVKELYKPHGNTAMLEAVNLALADLKKIFEGYGDYAHLLYLFTDGEENDSDRRTYGYRASTYGQKTQQELMRENLASLPDNVTVAAFVPSDPRHRFLDQAVQFGLPRSNVKEWDVTSADGVFEVGRSVAQASTTWMDNRAKGIRATRTLFSTGADAVNETTIAEAVAEGELEALAADKYVMLPVLQDAEIRPRVEAHKLKNGRHLTYTKGCAFYQLSKTEEIQASKELMIVEKDTNKVFAGPGVRGMLGLETRTRSVKPNHNPKYWIFVQSKSVNRKLIAGTQLLVQL
jgi:hypothetical protein